jgi:predicted amidophosphoribosyltransferase
MILSLCPDIFFRVPPICSECEDKIAVFGSLCEDCLVRREELRAEERRNTYVMERMGE